MHLAIGSPPVLIPPKLATLLRQLADAPPRHSRISTGTPDPQWLFPGLLPGRPAAKSGFSRKLLDHGIDARPARNAALIALLEDIPPAILADVLGLHISTAVRWADIARRDWTAYLAARDGKPHSGGSSKNAPESQPDRAASRGGGSSSEAATQDGRNLADDDGGVAGDGRVGRVARDEPGVAVVYPKLLDSHLESPVTSSLIMAATFSPVSARGLLADDHNVAVVAGADHRLAPDPKRDEVAVAYEAPGQKQVLHDFLESKHRTARCDPPTSGTRAT
jgi:hypothetical protein